MIDTEVQGDVDLAQAAQFLDMLAEGEQVTFQTFDDSPRKLPSLARILHGDLAQHAAALQDLNARGAGIFWMVNYGDGKGRTVENVTGIRALFLDLDGAPLQQVLAAGVEPHAVVESSPGKWHVYWMVTGCSLDQFKPAQQALAARFGGDKSVCDLPRVMRVPGFQHRKGEPFLARIVSLEPLQPYRFDELVQRLGLDLSAPAPAAPHVDASTGEIHGKVTAGGRHAHLSRKLADLNWRGIPEAGIRAALHQINERECSPPKAAAEVDALVSDWLRRYAGQHGRDADASQPDTPPAFSDDQLAVEFVTTYGAGYRWSPGLGWMADTGVVWRRDDVLSRFDLARRICRAAAARVPKSEGEQRRLASAKTVNAVIALAQSDQRLVVPATAWDAASMLLNTPAGVVDLRSGGIRARRADDYVTQATRVGPDFDRGAELFDNFMLDVFGGDHEMVDFMQRALGYCLTGDRREQVLFFLHGSGANGKSTLLDVVQWLLDTYALKLPAAALMVTRNDRHPTELAQLRGRRLAIASELEEGQFWNEALIKELTGDEVLTARFMRGDFFEFPMTQKHIIVGNHKPRLRGGDPAIARRLVLVPFEQRFEGARRDKGMLVKLKAEATAILAWMIRGAVRWHQDGLQIPQRVRDASADYMSDHDDLTLWVDECCVRSGEAKASELYASFSRWKHDRGEHPQALTTWGQRMQAIPGVVRRKSSGIRYTGLQLNQAEERRVRYGQ